MKKKRIAIDVDWVMAKLLHKWLEYYNILFDEELTTEDILEWSIVDFVKPEAEEVMLNILNLPDFYRDLAIRSTAAESIKELDKYYEILIVTDYFTKESFKAKYDWLREHLPFIKRENLVFTGNKSLILADYLIDDGVHNLETFQGVGILYDAPYNREETRFKRVHSWGEITDYFVDLYKKEHGEENLIVEEPENPDEHIEENEEIIEEEVKEEIIKPEKNSLTKRLFNTLYGRKEKFCEEPKKEMKENPIQEIKPQKEKTEEDKTEEDKTFDELFDKLIELGKSK